MKATGKEAAAYAELVWDFKARGEMVVAGGGGVGKAWFHDWADANDAANWLREANNIVVEGLVKVADDEEFQWFVLWHTERY